MTWPWPPCWQNVFKRLTVAVCQEEGIFRECPCPQRELGRWAQRPGQWQAHTGRTMCSIMGTFPIVKYPIVHYGVDPPSYGVHAMGSDYGLDTNEHPIVRMGSTMGHYGVHYGVVQSACPSRCTGWGGGPRSLGPRPLGPRSLGPRSRPCTRPAPAPHVPCTRTCAPRVHAVCHMRARSCAPLPDRRAHKSAPLPGPISMPLTGPRID